MVVGATQRCSAIAATASPRASMSTTEAWAGSTQHVRLRMGSNGKDSRWLTTRRRRGAAPIPSFSASRTSGHASRWGTWSREHGGVAASLRTCPTRTWCPGTCRSSTTRSSADVRRAGCPHPFPAVQCANVILLCNACQRARIHSDRAQPPSLPSTHLNCPRTGEDTWPALWPRAGACAP